MKKIILTFSLIIFVCIGSFAETKIKSNNTSNKSLQINTIFVEAHWEYSISFVYDSWGDAIGYIPTYTFYNASGNASCIETEPAVLF